MYISKMLEEKIFMEHNSVVECVLSMIEAMGSIQTLLPKVEER
jgi:hypothetical protein